MFRVLLPDGELTLSTRIEFLKETVNCEKTGTTDLVVTLDGANAVFVHLKEPYTSSKGVLFSNLTPLDIEDIKSGLLRDSYFDFTRFYSHKDERYYEFLSEAEFNSLIDD